METFLAILLALTIYVVIPVLIGLAICSIAILYDHKFNKKEKSKMVEELEKTGKETTDEKAKETIKVG